MEATRQRQSLIEHNLESHGTIVFCSERFENSLTNFERCIWGWSCIEKILWFEITVDNPIFMQVLHRKNNEVNYINLVKITVV